MAKKPKKYEALQGQSPNVDFWRKAVAELIRKATPGADILLGDNNQIGRAHV
jgi:hypothetical protein